jgi:hypothetical protein
MVVGGTRTGDRSTRPVPRGGIAARSRNVMLSRVPSFNRLVVRLPPKIVPLRGCRSVGSCAVDLSTDPIATNTPNISAIRGKFEVFIREPFSPFTWFSIRKEPCVTKRRAMPVPVGPRLDDSRQPFKEGGATPQL